MLYCHDNEHQNAVGGGYHGESTRDVHRDANLDFKPFAGLQGLFGGEDEKPDSK